MRFQFDTAKAAANWRKHGVSMAEAEGIFNDPLALHREDPDALGESRFVAIGESTAGRLIVLAYAVRLDTVRMISARRATRREAKAYAQGI